MAGKKAGKVISTQVWIKRGGMLLRADALPVDDPDSTYQQVIRAGGIPEEYGLKHPIAAEFDNKSREELIHEIIQLREELNSRHFHGMI